MIYMYIYGVLVNMAVVFLLLIGAFEEGEIIKSKKDDEMRGLVYIPLFFFVLSLFSMFVWVVLITIIIMNLLGIKPERTILSKRFTIIADNIDKMTKLIKLVKLGRALGFKSEFKKYMYKTNMSKYASMRNLWFAEFTYYMYRKFNISIELRRSRIHHSEDFEERIHPFIVSLAHSNTDKQIKSLGTFDNELDAYIDVLFTLQDYHLIKST